MELWTLENLPEDDNTAREIVFEVIQNFARISLQNIDVVGKSDSTRRQEVKQFGKHIGVGQVHGNNECCADER